jgi:hypothetical protein
MSISDLIKSKSTASLSANGDASIGFQPQFATPTELERLSKNQSAVAVGDGQFLSSNVVDRIKHRRASLEPADRSQVRRASLDISSFGKGLAGAGSMARP